MQAAGNELGRIRFINVGLNQEEIISRQSFEDIYNQKRHLILPSNHYISLRIRKIVEKLAENINKFIPETHPRFQVYVINEKEPNAFVLPGGQIFVNTGILSVALTDDGLATVLAHEVNILKNVVFNFRSHIKLRATALKSSQHSNSSL